MSYEYTVTINYTGEKNLNEFVAEIDLDELFTITFTAGEELGDDEITEMFEGEILEEMAETVDEFVPFMVDSVELTIGDVEVTEV